MTYYILIFTLTTLLGLVIDNSRNSLRTSRNKVRLCYVLVFLMLIVFVGLRDVSVGSDSAAYEYQFDLAGYSSLSNYLSDKLYSDPGFYTFTWLMKKAGVSVNLYFFVISIIFFGVILKFISKHSTSVGWSIWILNSLGFTTFAMSTLRQAMAMAFCLIAYMLWFDRKKLSWLFFIVACTFHLSAIIYTPMMFVDIIFKDKKPWKLVGIILITMLFAPTIMGFMMTVGYKNDRYSEASAVGGIGMIILLLLFVAMGLYTYFPRKKGIPDKIYYELFAVGLSLCAFLITRFNTSAMRLFWYFLSFTIVFVPNALSRMKPSPKAAWTVGLAIITLYYLCFRVMEAPYEESRLLLPYKFFWE